MHKKVKIVFSIIALLSCSALYAGSGPFEHLCTRTIYNNSDKPWSFKFYTRGGDVRVNGDNGCRAGQYCTVQAKSTATVDYYATRSPYGGMNGAFGDIQIRDSTKKELVYRYHENGVFYSTCVRLKHDGSTGSVTFNDPADGDFVVEKDSWKG